MSDAREIALEAARKLADACEKRGGNAHGHWVYCAHCGGKTEGRNRPIAHPPHLKDCPVAAFRKADRPAPAVSEPRE